MLATLNFLIAACPFALFAYALWDIAHDGELMQGGNGRSDH